ncbi:MAG: DUF1499 domain-containing protein [Nitrospirae bacterium]|nr:MAG: DUF1499 domain-containing protein [Nitrospirota bacterium]
MRSRGGSAGAKNGATKPKNKASLISRGGFIIALIAGLAALLSGPCTSHGLWDYRTGISVLRWAAYGGITAAVLSLIGLISSLRIVIVRGILWALMGVVIGGLVAGLMLYWKQVAESVPRIHDITTDTEDPPRFVAILRLHTGNENSAVYGGKDVASLQRKAYPDIVPLMLPLPPDQVFDRALAVARQLGWQIIDTDKVAGRIEAVDTTFWFGFKDDIVIRLSRHTTGSRVDIRSESRVGLGDLGKNAERIRKFLRKMKKER